MGTEDDHDTGTHRSAMNERTGPPPIAGRATGRSDLRTHSTTTHQREPSQPGAEQLRVAILAPISWRVPPRHYGPWEQFASLLTEGLVARGVDVTLFATADSITAARLIGVAPRGYSEDPSLDAKTWEALHIAALFERADEFDLIHNSFDFLPLTFTRLVPTPVITTIHGFASDATLPVYLEYADRVSYVAISDADRHPALPYAATIHHGIDIRSFDVGPGGDGVVFFGRIHPDKGTSAAIEVAKRAGVRLTIAGIVQDEEYFRREVEPHIDGDRVTYLGPVGPDRRQAVLGNARALLHLIDFDEPFGFSVVEAMACGTPVIAHRRGSMSEIIQPGINGYLVDTADAAVDAVSDAGSLERLEVHQSIEDRFDVTRMVEDYLALYHRILARA